MVESKAKGRIHNNYPRKNQYHAFNIMVANHD